MKFRLLLLLGLWAATVGGARAFEETPVVRPAPAATRREGKAVVYVIPVRQEIAKPILYILRRGLKEAIDQKADAVVLDMDTPGGEGGTMLEIMEALDKYPAGKITFVNREAISAGAMIAAVTDEIYFTPKGLMGAAEVVQGTGENLPDSMKRKIDSYLTAKIEAYSQVDPRRADVIKAMRIADFELKLDGKVIKPKGELLTVTAEKAMARYGEPPRPLLGAGVVKDLDELLAGKYGAGNYTIHRLEISWSEQLAQYLTALAPALMGLGLLALFIEFKTPGFGFFGISGIVLLLLVFFGHYAAGLSGHEPAILFVLGVALLAAELLLFPGTIVAGLTGVVFVFGSLIWAGADLWPNQPITISGDVFARPVFNLALALAISVTLFAVLARYLPQTGLWQHLSVQGASVVPAQIAGLPVEQAASLRSLVGHRGIAVTGLFPSGEVEIEGRRYQARVELGVVEPKSTVVVTGATDFGLKVEKEAQT